MDDFSWLKTAIDKIETKVDRLDQTLDSMDKTSIKQSIILEEHQRRSIANESNLDLLRRQFEPVKTHVDRVEFAFKAIGFLTTITGVITGVFKLFNVF